MRAAILGVLVLAVAAPGLGADKPISGAKLILSRNSSGSEKLTFVSKDVNFLFAAIGGADDPSGVGASMTLVSPAEPPVTFGIPSGIGNPGWKTKDGATRDGYQFTNGSAPAGISVVRSGKLRERRGIKIVARETGLALAAPQSSVGIRITTGSLRNCALFDAATIVRNEPNRFIARGAISSSLADCSDASLGATTSTTTLPPGCGNGVVEGSEQCDGASCGDPSGFVDGCFPPGDPNECECCSTEGFFCSEGSVFNAAVPCCPGFRCEIQFHIGQQGNGTCTTSPCNGYGSVCDGNPCCDGLVCTSPSPGFPLYVCDIAPPPTSSTTSTTSPTTTSTTVTGSCGDGIVQSGEACDGSGCDALNDGCFPPGDPDECQCCSTTSCYPGHFVECCPGLNCESLGLAPGTGPTGTGFCTTDTCAARGHNCDDSPDYLACCEGLACGPLYGQTFPYPKYCLVLPGGSCSSDAQCAAVLALPPHCVDGVCYPY
jgi:hypothetical protein